MYSPDPHYVNTLQRKTREIAISLRWIQCVALVNEQRQLNLRPGRVQLHDSGDLNAEVSQENGAPKVALNTEFLDLLDAFNRHTFHLGYPSVIGGELDYDVIQMLFDAALRITLKIAPRGLDPLASHLLERFRATTSHEQFSQHYSNSLSRDAIELLHKEGVDTSEIKSWLDRILQIFLDPGSAFDFHELQIRFLLFHELAHYFLGHLNQAINSDQEYEADHHAADLLFKHIERASESAATSPIAPAALPTLFLHMNFVEDLIGLCARCTRFAMKEDFRPMFKQATYGHPHAYDRVRRIVQSFPSKFNAQHTGVTAVMEAGVGQMKRCIQLGLIDLKNLKYYCRVRAIEQTHRAVMSLLKNREHKIQFVDKLEFSATEWDSDDLVPGPLVSEVFEGDWSRAFLEGLSNGH